MAEENGSRARYRAAVANVLCVIPITTDCPRARVYWTTRSSDVPRGEEHVPACHALSVALLERLHPFPPAAQSHQTAAENNANSLFDQGPSCHRKGQTLSQDPAHACLICRTSEVCIHRRSRGISVQNTFAGITQQVMGERAQKILMHHLRKSAQKLHIYVPGDKTCSSVPPWAYMEPFARLTAETFESAPEFSSLGLTARFEVLRRQPVRYTIKRDVKLTIQRSGLTLGNLIVIRAAGTAGARR